MDTTSSTPVETVGFILVPNFALMSYASATEPLRAANLVAGREIYRIENLALEDGAVASSSGVTISCKSISAAGSDVRTVFVCAGGAPGDWQYPELYAALRRLSHAGIVLGGISGGPFLLAAAGLLSRRDFTIHWEHAPALQEAFPDLEPRQARFVIDGDRITCGGGVAPLDMMHAMIAQRMGEDFARRVSDWFLHASVSEPAAPQRAVSSERFGTRHPGLLAVLEKMEATIERPLGRAAMVRIAGVGARQLDRLFRDHLGAGFLETYHGIRLRRARQLLLQSALAVSEIAFATGFSSAGHFSRAFKATYGVTPGQIRRLKTPS